MKIPWKVPRSRSVAREVQWVRELKLEERSEGWRQRPGDWWPLHISMKAFRIRFFLGERGLRGVGCWGGDDVVFLMPFGRLFIVLSLLAGVSFGRVWGWWFVALGIFRLSARPLGTEAVILSSLLFQMRLLEMSGLYMGK